MGATHKQVPKRPPQNGKGRPAMLLDLLEPPGRCSGCWPHDGEVDGCAVEESGCGRTMELGRSRRPLMPLLRPPAARCEVPGIAKHAALKLRQFRRTALAFVAPNLRACARAAPRRARSADRPARAAGGAAAADRRRWRQWVPPINRSQRDHPKTERADPRCCSTCSSRLGGAAAAGRTMVRSTAAPSRNLVAGERWSSGVGHSLRSQG